MTTIKRVSYRVVGIACALLLTAGLTGCPTGDEIVIPSSDATPPSLGMDFHLPDGTLVTVTPASVPDPTTGVVRIAVPGGGKVSRF